MGKQTNTKHVCHILIVVGGFADEIQFCRHNQLLHSLFPRGRHSQINANIPPSIRVNANENNLEAGGFGENTRLQKETMPPTQKTGPARNWKRHLFFCYARPVCFCLKLGPVSFWSLVFLLGGWPELCFRPGLGLVSSLALFFNPLLTWRRNLDGN